MTDKESNQTKLAVIANDISYIKKQIRHIDEQVSENYITKAEFEPIKKLVYLVATLIFSAVVTGGMALLIK